MGSDERDFVNIDLSSEEVQKNYLDKEKRRKYLSDMERLKRIREASRKKNPERYASTASTAPEPPVKKRRRRKRSGGMIRNIIIVLLLFLTVYGVRNIMFGRSADLLNPLPAEERPKKGFYTVAVFGVDSRDGNIDRALSDVNMIAVLNWETGEIRICSVFRDTFVQINEDGKHHKFNEAYFKGGSKQALWTMKYNLDIVPDDYITFNWKAVIDAINIMGGVDIEITEPEFAYINAFITETVEATGIGSVHLKSAGMNHLDGVQAVAYARLRLMDTDFNRTERQRKVVSLLMDKLKKADTKKRIEVVTSVLPETRTSIFIDDLLPLAKDVSKFYIGKTDGFPFERETTWIEKKDCVVPITLESNVIQLHEFLFDDKDYKPSKSVQEVSNYIIKHIGKK
ncbi:MAG: LCP family protein [Stomatobaculum sp.]|nr:LCP family protein [Stomatobaculum sp.]